jgi:acyl-CoA thioesterase FadM/ketosteroid isomerase-like protein
MVDLSRGGFELTVEAGVEPGFLDAMGHMNVKWYAHLFDQGVWTYFARHGLDGAYFQAQQRGMFALEQTTRFVAELREGEAVRVHTALLEVREKTLRLAQRMLGGAEGRLAATAEVVAAHIDIGTRRTTPFPRELAATLRSQLAATVPEGPLTEAAAQAFAREWVAAWNRHDAEAVLAHYADDALFVSPKAERLVGNGLVVGKAALRSYWQTALTRAKKLEFVLDAASYSPRSETLTVLYSASIDGQPPVRATEIMRFRDGRIVRGEALYGATAVTPPPP